jgi:hypothetical protein
MCREILLITYQEGENVDDISEISEIYSTVTNTLFFSSLLYIVSKPKGVPRACTSLLCNLFLHFIFSSCLHLGVSLAKPTPKNLRLGLSFNFQPFTLHCLPHLSLGQGCVARSFFQVLAFLFYLPTCAQNRKALSSILCTCCGCLE